VRNEYRAATATGLFLFFAPGVVAGLARWALTRWRMAPPFLNFDPTRELGAVLVAVGVPVPLDSFWRFAREGIGSPAPIYPTERLVVTGLYRHVRNPMYLAVEAVIFGQALLLGNAVLLIDGAAVALAFHLFILDYEEPTLERAYGAQYATYRANVPCWLPRFTAWRIANGKSGED
jgi:protein-S-isoprenylcysteine O-methyltransferase Ste14